MKRPVFGLIALSLWAFPTPVKAQTQANLQFNTQTQIQLAQESVIYKSDAPSQPTIGYSIHQKPTSISPKNGADASTPKTGVYNGRDYSGKEYTKEEVQQLIIQYSQEDGISPDLPLRVANCESGYNQFSKNKSSTASGVYQWLRSSWDNQPASQGGVSVFDADANVSAGVWLIAHGQTSPWNASKSCWQK